MKPSEQSARQIFEALVLLTDPGKRRALIECKCAGNDELRREVESLLQAHEQAGNFMKQTVPLPASDFVTERTGTL